MRPLDILAGEELERIHQATLDVLEHTGFLIQHAATRDRLDGIGCTVRGDRVLMSADLVARALESAPSEFTLHGRKSENDCPLVQGRSYALSTSGSPFVIDVRTGERRSALVGDVADFARLVDALPHSHMVSPPTPKDVEPEIVSPVRVATMLRNTTKPMRVIVESGVEVRYILQVAAVAHGGLEAFRARPQLQISVSPLSPLTLSEEATQAIVETAEAGVPLGVVPAPMVGATGPMSLAGCLVQQNAEVLGGIVIAQTVNPGTPVVYESRLTIMDMRSGQSIWGNPEVALTNAAAAQLARYYGVPGSVTAFGTSAKGMDDQNGFERAFNLLAAVMAGASILGAMGAGDNVLHTSVELIVLDDELVAWVDKLMRGMRVDDESLAVTAIHEAVMGDGSFLALRHTRDFLRGGEIWTPALSDRLNYEVWDQEGRPTIQQRARAKALELLANHEVEPLPEDVDREIDAVIDDARAELVVV